MVEWIKLIDPSFQDVKLSTLKSRIERLCKSEKKLEHKKVRGRATLELLNNEYFLQTFPTSSRSSADNLVSVTSDQVFFLFYMPLPSDLLAKYFFKFCGQSLLTLKNSVDPDEMPHYVAFHLGLHYL